MTKIDLNEWAGDDKARRGLVSVLLAVAPGAEITDARRGNMRFSVWDDGLLSSGPDGETAISAAITACFKMEQQNARARWDALSGIICAIDVARALVIDGP